MITVRLYGLLRLDTGIREQEMEADTVGEALRKLAQCGVPAEGLAGCLVLVNGETAQKRRKLRDGDVVQLMPPVAGG